MMLVYQSAAHGKFGNAHRFYMIYKGKRCAKTFKLVGDSALYTYFDVGLKIIRNMTCGNFHTG